MTGTVFEPFPGNVDHDLTLLGEALGYDDLQPPNIIWGPLVLSFLGDETVARLPPAPFVSATQPTRTSGVVQWVATTQAVGVPPVTSWVIQRQSSTDGGTTFGSWADISGSPFAAATLTTTQTLPTGTPEIVFQYRGKAVNSDGPSEQWSNTAAIQWLGNPQVPPTACTSFLLGVVTDTTAPFTWQETPDPTVLKHGLYHNGHLVVDNIDKNALSYTWTDLTPGTDYANVKIARANLTAGTIQWSPLSNTQDFRTLDSDPPVFDMLMGCDAGPNDHGGTNVWDGWRIYNQGDLFDVSNRTGNLRPKFMAYSENGPNLGSNDAGDLLGNYAGVKAHVIDVLNQYYYTTATGQTHTARWGIILYWSNGNENADKGSLKGTHTTARINHYIEMQRALYDGVHYIDPTTNQRRFPDAYAGSDPTQYHEKDGIVADWLHPSARYHDFVMWSYYPPGRQQTGPDPTYNWPSFKEADRTNGALGFMIRANYRTAQARAQARIDTGDPNFEIFVGCGEIGTGADPSDSSTRPYYVVHALAGGLYKMAQKYRQECRFACWWDKTKGGASDPQNILSDEPSGTNPSTRQAWQNWMQYDHEFGGTHPASWANNPKPAWKTTGPVV